MQPEGLVRKRSSLFLINANIASSIRQSYHQLADTSMGWKSPRSKVTGIGTALHTDAGSGPLATKDNYWCKSEPDHACVVSVLNDTFLAFLWVYAGK